jgi:hypothetical protein
MVAAAAGAVGFALPAAAAGPPDVQIIALSGSMNANGTTQLQYSIKNNSASDSSAQITISFGGDLNGLVTCTGGQCNGITPVPNDNNAHTFTATLSAGDVAAGQTRNGVVTVQVTIGSESAQKQGPLAVNGPAAQAAVPQLSGVVVDVFKGDSGPIANAKVAAQDSATPTPHTWEVGTDVKGTFKILSTADKPIAPGTIVFIVTKDGYQQYKQIISNAVAGQPLTTLHFAMTPTASTASASATGPTPTGAPTSEIETQGVATGNGNSGSGGGLSWVLIGIGGVLVALGIAAIVILLIRRRGDDDDDEGGQGGRGPKGGRGGAPRPPHPQGGRRPEPTMVMRGGPGGPGGRGPGAPGSRDQTMIARSPLADMPTQLHGRVPPPGGPGGPPPGQGYGGQNPYGGSHQQPYGGGGSQSGYGGGQGYPGGSQPPNYGQPDPYGSGYGQQPPGGYPQQPGHGGNYPGGYDEQDPRGPRRGDRRVDWLEE